MKVIIDISEDVYTRLFDNGIQDNEIAVDDVCEMARALRLGIPLDSVKTEIADEYVKTCHLYNYLNYACGLNKALEIINKHVGKDESESKK